MAGGDRPVLGEGALSADALRQANINPETGLATDYLNHFNEVIMLMEMLPDMPDCAEDVLEWEPAGYCDHFAGSAFKDKDLAVLAYRAAPKTVRGDLETLILQIDNAVLEAKDQLAGDASPDTLATVAAAATTGIKPLISAASGIINGSGAGDTLDDQTAQDDVDALFG